MIIGMIVVVMIVILIYRGHEENTALSPLHYQHCLRSQHQHHIVLLLHEILLITILMTTKKNLIIIAIRSNSVPKPKLQTEVGPGHTLAVDLQHLFRCLIKNITWINMKL